MLSVFSSMQDCIIDLQKFKLVRSVLYVEGIGIITGQNAKDYGHIDYKLIIKNSSAEYVKQLGKAHRPELTQKYAAGIDCSYDKCWFATLNYQGVDIADVPVGSYELFLKITVNGFVKIISLGSQQPINFENELFSFKTDMKQNQFIIKQILKKGVSYHQFSNEKLKVDGCYHDEFNNIIEAPSDLHNVQVQFFGKNNRVVINKDANLKNTFIEFRGNDANFTIGKNAKIHGSFRLGYGCSITIGNDTSSTNGVYVTCAEYTKITIGNDCMFATNNQIRTDDSHGIYDVNTGRRVNFSKDIIIGNHVWIAYGATILGGAAIGDGSVVGAYSLVKKSIPNNSVAAGIPAKVIRKDIFWERPLLLNQADEMIFPSEYLQEQVYIAKTEDFDLGK